MDIYKTKVKRLRGTSYSDVYPQAFSTYKLIASKTKRRPYVRSTYFKNEKVFLDYFWQHLREKNLSDRARRLAFYNCALDLIKYCRIKPVLKLLKNKSPKDMFYRFVGITKENESFVVQIKENYKKKEKYFISVFPLD